MTMSKEEFVKRYNAAEPAVKYALAQSLTNYFTNDEVNKEDFKAYWDKEIEEFNKNTEKV